ncbi:hypothetical protein DNTS_004836, partial [Danionella cerebrum]
PKLDLTDCEGELCKLRLLTWTMQNLSSYVLYEFYPSFHRSLCSVSIRFQWREV